MLTSAVKFYVNYEKEEAWLNELAAKGMNLVHYSFLRYLFEEGKPGEYIYRIELLKELPSHPESRAYIRFMEETGVECVCTYLRWVYFRKKASEGPFSIYTDVDSKIRHLRLLASLFGVVGCANLIIGLSNLVIGLGIGAQIYTSFNAYVSLVNLSLGALLGVLTATYLIRIRKHKKEKALHE